MARAQVSAQRAAATLSALAAGERVDPVETWAVMRALPPGLDVELVFRAFERLASRPYDAGLLGAAVAPAYVEFLREVLARHPRWPQAIASAHVRAGTPAARAQQLVGFLGHLERLGTPGLTPGQVEERVRAAASDAPFVEVARAVVAGADFGEERSGLRPALLAVLLEDGAQESVDVLLPFITEALEGGGSRLEAWRALLTTRPGLKRAVRPLRELLEVSIAARRSSQAIPRLLDAIGLPDAPPSLAWVFLATSVGERSYDARLAVDLAIEPAFTLTVTLAGSEQATVIDSTGVRVDRLGLGRLGELGAFPTWFAAATAQLGADWGELHSDALARATVRGAARKRLARWHWSGFPPR